MANKKKKEELQSRRDFFKNAAKGVLPVLGAIVLSGIPNLVKAEKAPMGCRYGCSGSCLENCYTTCYQYCSSSCKGTCKYTCRGNCRESCTGTCSGGCYGMEY
ncbi:Cys-Xaa-Xaa-Xaa repeat radical SAM target protein [Prevotella sp.]|uniref:Cys-Xaa-Xaa-Xaa repeat radical SAM target protein n=1 Tax=Prevotella sp. TaxID=59823 RepID=UPI00258A8A1D|nr:Cys-Xaa-Xaa-Xaa repeat radical SAM target protein [Prevotella sp.]